MACNELLNTQALFDGELDADATRAAAAHATTCPECTALLRTLEATRSAMRGGLQYRHADAGLRDRIASALDREQDDPDSIVLRAPGWRFWTGALGGMTLTALAAALVFFLVLPSDSDELVADVTSAHVRSLVGTHLLDVSSNDPVAVRRWLGAHAGLAPPIADFTSKGFPLAGGRADYLYDASAAVAVYRDGNHVVNLFVWPEIEDEDLPKSASHNGFNIVFWKKGNIVYCAVSNIAMVDLERFANLAKGMS